MTMKRGYACKHCGGGDHYAMVCFKRPQTPIKVESDRSLAKRRRTRRAWFSSNKHGPDGFWDCYLQIDPKCVRRVNAQTIDLEHVRSKTRHPKLKYEIKNIKAACQPCNKLKRSWSLEDLAATYPHIFDMITTPEWVAYEQELDRLEA